MKHKLGALAFAAAVFLGLGSGAMASPAGALNTASAALDRAPNPAIQLVQDYNVGQMRERWIRERDPRWRHGRHWRDGPRWRHHRGWQRPPYYHRGPGIEFHIAPAPRYRPRPSHRLTQAHYRWCQARYRSYRAWDNTFQPYNGPRRQCISPYV